MRRPGSDFSPWRLRQFLLQNKATWRALALDVRQDLAGVGPRESCDVLDRWDDNLVKGLHTARFFEVWLNVCDGAQLAAAVAARAADLRSLDPLLWWDDPNGDLRERFARLAPMEPLPVDSLMEIRKWLQGPPRTPSDDDLVGLDDEPRPPTAGEPRLSTAGLARWRCLDALSVFHRQGVETAACWKWILNWTKGLPLGALETADRYRFVAWIVHRMDEFDSSQVAPLANWLFNSGVTDIERINNWADEIEEDELRLARVELVSDLKDELKKVRHDSHERLRKMKS